MGLDRSSKRDALLDEQHESFWKLFKDSINGTHIHISAKHLDRYLGEFEFRSNFRQMRNAMFDLLVAAL